MHAWMGGCFYHTYRQIKYYYYCYYYCKSIKLIINTYFFISDLLNTPNNLFSFPHSMCFFDRIWLFPFRATRGPPGALSFLDNIICKRLWWINTIKHVKIDLAQQYLTNPSLLLLKKKNRSLKHVNGSFCAIFWSILFVLCTLFGI